MVFDERTKFTSFNIHQNSDVCLLSIAIKQTNQMTHPAPHLIMITLRIVVGECSIAFHVKRRKNNSKRPRVSNLSL